MIEFLLAALCGAGFTAGAAAQAAHDGVVMVQNHRAYSVSKWVLYQSADPLRAVHGQAGVDAVIVETPYERVRYEAYLDALQGIRVTPAEVAKMRREASSHVGFLIYAHSRTETDRRFLAAFRPAQIRTADAGTEPDDAAVRFGPSDDFYDVGTFREERWVGSVDYRFPLRDCRQRGKVDFSDGYGRSYDLPFDLSRYR